MLNRLKALREEKGWKIGLSLSGVGQSKALAKALQTGPLDMENGETMGRGIPLKWPERFRAL